ncbi:MULTISPECIES: hypothetical protein [Pseudomonas]|nr:MULTISPECIES: hypothetical protein [Pseudomonas]
MNDESRRDEHHSRDYPVREDMAYQVKVWRFELNGKISVIAQEP